MRVFKQNEAYFRQILLIVFNGGAVRNAYAHRLFSREFCLGCFSWASSASIILWHITARISLPEWFMVLMAIFAVFTGCCWVAFPTFIYLINTIDQILEKQINPGRCIRYLMGWSLWHQAVQGKLSFQFLGAMFLEGGSIWIAGHWPIHTSWQVLFNLALCINTLFYLVFPLFLFLGQWIHRGMSKALFPKNHPTHLSQT